MSRRVIQRGTGNTGAHALRFLLEDPAFDVVGVWVKREQNVGRSAGELAGLAPGGPRATHDVDELVALDTDCVVYMAAEPSGSPTEPGTDGWESVDTMCRLLASGKNVVATGISGLTNPRAFRRRRLRPLVPGDRVRREHVLLHGHRTGLHVRCARAQPEQHQPRREVDPGAGVSQLRDIRPAELSRLAWRDLGGTV
jgi:hypothetical protein